MTDETQDKGFKVVDRRSGAEQPTAEQPASPATEGRPAKEVHEIDFSTFVISLGSSALVHLGQLGHPGGEGQHRDLALAKQTVDILGMLAEKTRGNLTADENRLLEHLLYDLRLKYVEEKKKG
jgi:hypothetical protein